ncbi:MAG: hypothetical protein ACYTG7_23375, partial [Planctomycetota bacterium]
EFGSAYITGETKSTQGTFPVFVGPDLTYNGGDRDAFVAKVSADGRTLVYCGYIGGAEKEEMGSIAVDPMGCAYVTAQTLSTETSLPVVIGPDLTHNGIWDTFIAKVAADGTGLDYCGFIGGDGNDFGWDVTTDSAGSAYVTGWTYSKATTFPVAVGPDLSFNGKSDAFVAKVNAGGTHLDFCGYIGGDEFDQARSIAVDGELNVLVAGWTRSTETTFPVLAGPDLTYNGWYWDGFVAKVTAGGNGLDYCGYIGGDADDHCEGIDVDPEGLAYVTGRTNSTQATFPVVLGPDLTHNGGYSDAFVARISDDGSQLDYCGYIGGDNGDFGEEIAVDLEGSAYVVGATYSNESSFPVLIGPVLSYGGDEDGFVVKVSMALTRDAATISASSGGIVDFTLHAGMDHAGRSYVLLGGVSGTEPGTLLPGGLTRLPLNFDVITTLILSMLNTSLFHDFNGVLDATGRGSAQLNTLAISPLPPVRVGGILYFAYTLYSPYDFASNAVEVEIVP